MYTSLKKSKKTAFHSQTQLRGKWFFQLKFVKFWSHFCRMQVFLFFCVIDCLFFIFFLGGILIGSTFAQFQIHAWLIFSTIYCCDSFLSWFLEISPSFCFQNNYTCKNISRTIKIDNSWKKKKNQKENENCNGKKLVINLWLNTDNGKYTVTNGNNAHTTYRRNRRKLIFLWKKSHHQSNKNRSKSAMRRLFEKCWWCWRVVKVNVFEKRYRRMPGEKTETSGSSSNNERKKERANEGRKESKTKREGTQTDSAAWNKYVAVRKQQQRKWKRARGIVAPNVV